MLYDQDALANPPPKTPVRMETPFFLTLFSLIRMLIIKKHHVRPQKLTDLHEWMSTLKRVQADTSGCCNKSRYYTQNNMTQYTHLYGYPECHFYSVPVYSSCHVLLTIVLPVSLFTLSWFPSTDFYAHFEFAHNKWDENESFLHLVEVKQVAY